MTEMRSAFGFDKKDMKTIIPVDNALAVLTALIYSSRSMLYLVQYGVVTTLFLGAVIAYWFVQNLTATIGGTSVFYEAIRDLFRVTSRKKLALAFGVSHVSILNFNSLTA